MHPEQKRIFVNNLPPDVKEGEVEKQFSSYGNVVSVEVKHRKESTNQSISSVFAFVNIQIDDRTLNKCFNEFYDYDWNGYTVSLQLAKESFLERLKREREETNNKPKESTVVPPRKEEYVSRVDNTLYKSSSSSESSGSESEEEVKVVKAISKVEKKFVEEKVELDYVIKNNKFKNFNGKAIKIDSFSDKPIHVINPKVEKHILKDPKAQEAEEKRKKSLLLMKTSYQQQKLAIKSALSNVDNKQNNKIIFDDEVSGSKKSNKRKNNKQQFDESNSSKKNKFSLFDEDIEEDSGINFGIKKQFEGQKGHKLLELQSRFTSDKRFTLDSRFLDEGDEVEANGLPEEDERQQQMEILESVLGRKVVNKRPLEADSKDVKRLQKAMLRFDPSKPEHAKFEIKESEEQKELRKKSKKSKNEAQTIEETNPVEVSKETFYQVTDNLKQSLQEKQSFSLLSMFGRTEEKEEQTQPEEMRVISNSKQYGANRNPFKYDSSDSDEEETTTDKVKNKETNKEIIKVDAPLPRIIGRETFFFNDNDDRLQEGLDFLKKLGSQVTVKPFEEKRRELKLIVRAKVRNNQRNNRPFHKLGRHKMIKVKKAKRK